MILSHGDKYPLQIIMHPPPTPPLSPTSSPSPFPRVTRSRVEEGAAYSPSIVFQMKEHLTLVNEQQIWVPGCLTTLQELVNYQLINK